MKTLIFLSLSFLLLFPLSSAQSLDDFTSNIISVGRAENLNRYLSVTAECDKTTVDLYTYDDESGRQKFRFQRIAGTSDQYKISIAGGRGCTKRFLSSSEDCAAILPDAYLWNDISEVSKIVIWRLEAVPGVKNTFNIINVGRVACDYKFLSCTDNGNNNVPLQPADDLTGYQRWRIPNFPAFYKSIQISGLNMDLSKKVLISTKVVKGSIRTIVNKSPTQSDEIEFESCTENVVTQSWKSTQSDAFTLSQEAGVSVSVKAGGNAFGASVEAEAEGNARMSSERSSETSISNGKSQEKREKQCIKAKCTAPPKKKAECFTKFEESTYEIPFTATETRYYFDGTYVSSKISGVQTTSDCTNVYQINKESDIVGDE